MWAKRFKNLGCDYLILDCLRPVLDTLWLDENHETGQFLTMFDALLSRPAFRRCLVHHMGTPTNARAATPGWSTGPTR